jgi:hypothetical protein
VYVEGRDERREHARRFRGVAVEAVAAYRSVMGRTAIAIAAALVAAALGAAAAAGCNSHDVAACTDANVELIQASNYDQTCSVDTDCVAIAVGNACYPCIVLCGTGGAINRNALSSYQSDISKTIGAGETSGVQCGCPGGGLPCCRGGTCQVDFQCSSRIADAGAE